jgi:hypothetical protein
VDRHGFIEGGYVLVCVCVYLSRYRSGVCWEGWREGSAEGSVRV